MSVIRAEELVHTIDSLEKEFERHCIAVGFDDWSDELEAQQLAQEIASLTSSDLANGISGDDLRQKSVATLAALSNLILKEMTLAADMGFELHAGPAWRSIGRYLYKINSNKD